MNKWKIKHLIERWTNEKDRYSTNEEAQMAYKCEMHSISLEISMKSQWDRISHSSDWQNFKMDNINCKWGKDY